MVAWAVEGGGGVKRRVRAGCAVLERRRRGGMEGEGKREGLFVVSYNIVGALFSVAENRRGGGHVMEGDGGTVCLAGWSNRRVGE